MCLSPTHTRTIKRNFNNSTLHLVVLYPMYCNRYVCFVCMHVYCLSFTHTHICLHISTKTDRQVADLSPFRFHTHHKTCYGQPPVLTYQGLPVLFWAQLRVLEIFTIWLCYKVRDLTFSNKQLRLCYTVRDFICLVSLSFNMDKRIRLTACKLCFQYWQLLCTVANAPASDPHTTKLSPHISCYFLVMYINIRQNCNHSNF